MKNNILGDLSIHEFEDPTIVELSGTVKWDGQVTDFSLICEHIVDRVHDVNTAISWAESRMKGVFQALPLSKLRLWCLSQIQEELPWFLTERLLDPDDGGSAITSQPEEMISLLIPQVTIQYDCSVSRGDVNGWLSCPSLESDNKINHDVIRWLGNHNYSFVLNEQDELSGFGADG